MRPIYVDTINDLFASANTRFGFYSRFAEIFDRKKFNKIYIIKGGSGTGKSSLMKRIREKCGESSVKTEGILCSSDPSSLDGLLIGGSIAALIDGTAPHTADTVYPGAVDSLVDLGGFWNEDILRERKKEIMELTDGKSVHISQAYKLLDAAGKIYDDITGIISQDFDFFKMKKAVNIFFDKELKQGRRFYSGSCFTTCINRLGRGKTDSFENMSERVCTIENDRGLFAPIIETVIDEAKKRRIPVRISYDSLDPRLPDGVYFPENSLCIVRSQDRGETERRHGEIYKIFNNERFISKDILRKNKEKLRFAVRCTDELISAASACFSDAFDLHEKLEAIYISAMDFTAKESFTEKLTERILKEIS